MSDAFETESFESWLRARRGRAWLVVVAIAIALATAYMAQDYVTAIVDRKPVDSVWTLAPQRYLTWTLWALLSPIVALAGSRIRFGEAAAARSHAIALRLALWLLLGLALVVVHSALYVILGDLTRMNLKLDAEIPNLFARIQRRTSITFAANLLLFSLIVCVYHAVAYAHDLRMRERRAMRLESELARAELDLLKMQLQPHFVFNTLHTVSSLMGEDVSAARRVLSRLGDLLRFSLDSLSTQEVTLRDECAILDRYLDIQRATLQERLRVAMHIDDNTRDLRVPSLLLQPLVENAIRHAIEPRAAGGLVDVRARRDGDRLVLIVADDGPGLRSSGQRETRARVGLTNTRARLAGLYGTAWRLELRDRSEGGCEVLVELPARATTPMRPEVVA
jgi:two-component system, LytTR family, sensor kinase